MASNLVEGFSKSRIKPVNARTFTQCMEQLQEGYVATVAATAGCTTQEVRRDVYGVDIIIFRDGRDQQQEVSLYAQLKNTTTIKPDPLKPEFGYQFKKRLYMEKLTVQRTHPKAILIVMVTPPIQASWTLGTHNILEVRHCCYWKHLEGENIPDGVESPTVKIPTANVFDAVALNSIMDCIENGDPLQ